MKLTLLLVNLLLLMSLWMKKAMKQYSLDQSWLPSFMGIPGENANGVFLQMNILQEVI